MAPTRMRLTLGLAALAAVAACGDSASTRADADLQRDLQLAGSQEGIELLPSGPRTTVVSPIEQSGAAEPARAPTRARAPVTRPKAARVTPVRRTTPRTPAPAPTRRAARSEPKPVFDADVISPPPPGGYKTVDEVIRNAPFPIKPVGSRR